MMNRAGLVDCDRRFGKVDAYLRESNFPLNTRDSPARPIILDYYVVLSKQRRVSKDQTGLKATV